ncbi:glycosyltransferase involved in cell wall biosynthesis [Anaerosolibacter carboniphilus]|uniref:Glycosyltransferase involved in cell wall biosynthesis n=1 Tax=Anaerosolibacter carboniphilus TaxID=1417629 RepID=A0A841KRJ7_9FIRM|nr:glycosyltransferase [Anaerosolibacter carboniphilus]MBB6216374.1 glycosyltransferase involved in cell wall biosynthesis [Anaerosolibacter carboniphilus]
MKKVIMIVTNRYDPDVRVHKEAKYLVSRGFEVEILCWDRENEYINKAIEEMDGIKIRRFFPYAKYGTGIKQIKAYIKFILEIKKYLSKVEYSYLHCHDLDGVIAGYIGKSKKSKLIFDMHEFYEGLNSNNKNRRLIKWIVSVFQNKSKWIIYVNEVQTTRTSKKNHEKLIYLPNYPELSNYDMKYKAPDDKLRISYIGSVRQYNELKNLIDACKDMDDVLVAIHGMGVAYEKLKQIIGNYSNAILTGVFDFTQSSDLYCATDILYAVYPMDNIQNKLSYPVKFYEAIITKTPVIVSKGSVLEGFIAEHDIGFVVDGGNEEEIKDLVSYINNNKQILLEKVENLEKIQFNYSWEEVVKNLDVLYT